MNEVLSGRFGELPGSLARKVDEVCDRFERSWQSGERPRVEDFLGDAPEQERAALLGELLYLELDYRFPGNPEQVRARLNPAAPGGIAARYSPLRAPVAADETVPFEKIAGPDGPGPAVATPGVPGYQVLDLLGKGGMGVVYKARQVGLDRLVALKMMLHTEHASADDRRRFQTEAQAVARLQHPNIVQIHEVGEHQGQPYFSLEYCPGGTLANRLRGTPWEPAKAAELMRTLARAVHAAHEANVVHRDLKPANVLLGADGQPKIGDFGLAKKLDEQSQTQTGAVVGTPSYMAPEQAGGKGKQVGLAADIYALGAILYELLTGRPPFKAPSPLDTVLQVLSEDPVAVRRLQPQVPRDLETICLKCLEKEPRKRYASAAALAEDLRRFLAGEAIHARPARAIERGWRWCRRHRALASLAASIVVGLVLSSYLLVTMRAHAVAQRDKAIARRVVSTLFKNPELAFLPEQDFVDCFVELNPGVSKEDVLQAFRGSDWLRHSDGESDRPWASWEWHELRRLQLHREHKLEQVRMVIRRVVSDLPPGVQVHFAQTSEAGTQAPAHVDLRLFGD
jgi:tRNA A-37 threonylcarbamoyl transferase component Bud32